MEGKVIQYARRDAVQYARRWALSRNRAYNDFTKGGGEWLSEIAASGCNAVGLDWTVNMTRARRVVEDKVALQGNMDPLALFGPEETIRAEARKVMDGFGMIGNGGHVFNLGHGINQFTPIENVQILVDEVHEYSRRYH